MRSTWLITGAGGQLGSVLLRKLGAAGESVFGITSLRGPIPLSAATIPLDICDAESLTAHVARIRPNVIVHTAAVTSIQAAFENPILARRVNVDATSHLLSWAASNSARLIFTSTDLVFDGTRAPYDETNPVSPLSHYAQTKVQAEKSVLSYDRGVVLRTALMYGLPGVKRPTTFQAQLAALKSAEPLRLFVDEYRTPISLDDAAAACIAVGESDYAGILHVGGPQRLSRLEMGNIMARHIGAHNARIFETRQSDHPASEPRPRDVSLCSDQFRRVFGKECGRTMDEALAQIARELAAN